MTTQSTIGYKPLHRIKRGTSFRYYEETQVWVKGETRYRSVDMYKIEDTKMNNTFCAKNTDTVEIIKK
jgi:hypothetical protein